jgi:uncharacterized protein
MLHHALLQKIQTDFKCQRCNACCKQPGFVYLKPEEAEGVARFLGLDTYAFTDRFCHVLGRQHLVLKKNEDESCIFLTDSGCSIYDARPKQCREFPFTWRTKRSFEYCEGLQKINASHQIAQ